MTALYMHSDEFDDGHKSFFDVEAARKQLESLVGSGGPAEHHESHPRQVSTRPIFASISMDTQTSLLPEAPKLELALPPRSPLTTIERERRSAEIELLAHLNDGDEALNGIWNLWFAERGSKASALLHKADDMISEGAHAWTEAEAILRGLIEQYGVYFAEPLNRLATLYYLQGRHEEALTLNQMVLAIKPWHFGALSHIVMVYAALGDSVSARQWAAFRLPTISSAGSNRRRTRWVERAVVDATILLHEGEQNLSELFGETDNSWMQRRKSHNFENDDDAWQ